MSPLYYLHDVPDVMQAHSTPLDNPMHGATPARFSDGEVLVIHQTDPDAIRAVLPRPLAVLGDTVMVQVARWGDVPGAGRNAYEVNVMVPVQYDGPDGPIKGSYSPYFFVDNDHTMAGGREFHGQPKRMADVSLEVRGDLIVGSLRRNGIDVFTGTLPYKSRVASLDDVRRRVDFVTNINLKVIPQIDGTAALRQLTARDLTDIDMRGCWSGPATARIEAPGGLLLGGRLLTRRWRGAARLRSRGLIGGAIVRTCGWVLGRTHPSETSALARTTSSWRSRSSTRAAVTASAESCAFALGTTTTALCHPSVRRMVALPVCVSRKRCR